MAHRMDPPITDGPFNVMGMPEYRWGVDDNVSAALLERCTTWACNPTTRAQVGEVAFIPVTTEDAPEILDLMLRQGAGALSWQPLPRPSHDSVAVFTSRASDKALGATWTTRPIP